MTQQIAEFFADLEHFLVTEVQPIANDLDHDAKQLHNIYAKLIKLDALRLLIPAEYGGLGGGREAWIAYNILMAQYSGALLFLQAQHQFSIARLKKLLPSQKIVTYLSEIAKTDRGIGLCTIASKQAIHVTAEQNDFKLTGQLPWITGWQYFSEILISFVIEENIHYALIPFENIEKEGGKITVSEIISTVVFQSANTVSLTLQNWKIASADVLPFDPQADVALVEHPVIFNFAGAAKALLELAMHGKYFAADDAKITYASLSEQWQNYFVEIMAGKTNPLQLRARGLALAEKCAVFARVSCGAVGVLESHPLPRISREIWQYTVAGYTNDQFVAYLNHVIPSEARDLLECQENPRFARDDVGHSE